MNKVVVALLALATLLAPAAPSLAQGGDDRTDDDSEAGDRETNGSQATLDNASLYEGEHWTLEADAELPGIRNLTLSASGTPVASGIQLPGDEAEWAFTDDRARIETGSARLDVEDRRSLRVDLDGDDGEATVIRLADGVAVRNGSGDDARYRLSVPDGTDLALRGDRVAYDDGVFAIQGDARLQTAGPADDGASENRSDEPEEDSTDNATRADEGDEDNRTDRQRDDGARERPDRDDRSEPSADEPAREERTRRMAEPGPREVGDVSFTLGNDTLHDLKLRNATLFTRVDLPGLLPAEERDRGPQLRIDGEDAELRLVAKEGMNARLEAEAGILARLGPDVEVDHRGDHVLLSVDSLLVVAEGDEIDVDERILTAEELRLHAQVSDRPDDAVWRAEAQPASTQLPYTYEGRYVSFALNETGLENLTVHGTPLGDVAFAPATIDEIDRRGAHLSVEGEDFELTVEDAPAAQLRLEADDLAADLPNRTTLPSEARVTVDREPDELRIRVDRPRDVLSNRTSVEHQPARAPVEATEGPEPGLQATTEDSQLGITSADPSTLNASFTGQLNGTEGNVSLTLGLARAMLVDDTNGNGRVDVGEPAVAESPLANGTTSVEGDELVSTFPLWSGNLTVAVEPGDETAKVTYEVHGLSAPPGTLFVLETRVQAPAGAQLVPTDTGVTVQNGTMAAEYSAAGPVTVDGSDAWAQRSIFVDSDDQVRVLLAYPAGDDIVHDPTLSVQSMGAAQVAQALTASPYAIAAGALVAGLLVAGTVIHRRRQRPRP